MLSPSRLIPWGRHHSVPPESLVAAPQAPGPIPAFLMQAAVFSQRCLLRVLTRALVPVPGTGTAPALLLCTLCSLQWNPALVIVLLGKLGFLCFFLLLFLRQSLSTQPRMPSNSHTSYLHPSGLCFLFY